MEHNIKLKKFGFRTAVSNSAEFYKVLTDNRDRLSPWFWWTDSKVTPNFPKTVLFMMLYTLDTKRKKIMHRFSKNKTYDEQFLIFNENKLAGMTGLDNIDTTRRNAELWYFVTGENEGKGTMSASLKVIEEYAFYNKNLDSVYVKTAAGNTRSEALLERNNYQISVIERNVPTSPRNPKITDLTTWSKHR
jgi:RimJ/RimL family protein N-acetyltransferase